MTFGLSSVCYDIVFFVISLQHFIYVGGNSNRPSGFDQLKISDYGRQYVEELK